MLHSLMAEFLGTALMILFGVGVHCDEVLAKTKYHGSGHIFAITTWAFGISVTLFIFGGVCINPAMALCQAILGMIPWSSFIPYCIAEFLGALFGALVVIDGPAAIQRLFGYDMGISAGSQKMMSFLRMVQQARMQHHFSSQARNARKDANAHKSDSTARQSAVQRASASNSSTSQTTGGALCRRSHNLQRL